MGNANFGGEKNKGLGGKYEIKPGHGGDRSCSVKADHVLI